MAAESNPVWVSSKRLNVGVFLLSAALLALEVLYTRLVSILLFPIAAYLVISLALMGLGLAGGLLALRPQARQQPAWVGASAAGFSASVLASVTVLWFAGNNPAWAWVMLPLALGLPMFLGGMALTLALTWPSTNVRRLYMADLTGAGLGAILTFSGMNWLDGVTLACLIAGLGWSAAWCFWPTSRRVTIGLGLAVGLTLVALGLPHPYGFVPIAPIKELRMMLMQPQPVQWEYQGWSSLARVDVLSIPGDTLSPNLPIPYKLVTQDGGAPSLLLDLHAPTAQQTLIEQTIFGVPYWIHTTPKVLIIGLGGGPDVQAALAGGAREVLGAEVNPRMIDIVTRDFAEFTGQPYADPRVTIVLADGRQVLEQSTERFDIIQLTGVDTSVAAMGGNPSLSENYLYTEEAFVGYLNHLTPTGTLSVSFPNTKGLGLRLLALARTALSRVGMVDFEQQVVVAEMTGYVHVLVKRTPFTAAEIATLQAHYAQSPSSIYFPLYHRLFGYPDAAVITPSRLVLAPGLSTSIEPYAGYVQALRKGQEAAFLAAQAQTVQVPTDDWPFFFVLDKWGYSSPYINLLLLLLGILSFFSTVLILLPPWMQSRQGWHAPRAAWLAVYFGCLGLGFIFVEVNLIQHLSLVLGHPSYAIVTTLGTLLIASGLGSGISERWGQSEIQRGKWGAVGAAILTLGLSITLKYFSVALLALPLGVRIGVAAGIVAVPGLFMGVPFPAGLSAIKRDHPTFVPWAWAINSVFTVIGTILALLLALGHGFQFVFFVAAALYSLAALALWLWKR
jgi:spermidine synthase